MITKFDNYDTKSYHPNQKNGDFSSLADYEIHKNVK
jgi:hypothetical protein